MLKTYFMYTFKGPKCEYRVENSHELIFKFLNLVHLKTLRFPVAIRLYCNRRVVTSQTLSQEIFNVRLDNVHFLQYIVFVGLQAFYKTSHFILQKMKADIEVSRIYDM